MDDFLYVEPVPEPSATALIALTLSGGLLRRKRRRAE
jgi:hypothetical protein